MSRPSLPYSQNRGIRFIDISTTQAEADRIKVDAVKQRQLGFAHYLLSLIRTQKR